MRKIGTIFGITAFAAISFSTPVAAFGVHLGPFYFHVPFVGHHHRHRLQMRANEAGTKPNDVSRGAAKPVQADREARFETDTQALGNCAGLVPEPANLPIEQIRLGCHAASKPEGNVSRATGAVKQNRLCVECSVKGSRGHRFKSQAKAAATSP